jgi:prolyl-tRNA editing enzyme YbaK/EbsC (Cys-tRNA(Pro) deacylase)
VTALTVKAHLDALGLGLQIIEHGQSTATVALAAKAFGVAEGQIAKTLAFRLGNGQAVLVVASGDVRVDNGKFKQVLGRGKMLPHDDVVALTGHPVGGVCPFGLATPLPIYLDQSLLAYDEVVPAAGGTHNGVRVSPQVLAAITQGEWVDVCSGGKRQ